jgi:hypothetical protein
LIFFGYFFVSRQKSNWGLGQRPIFWASKKMNEKILDEQRKNKKGYGAKPHL